MLIGFGLWVILLVGGTAGKEIITSSQQGVPDPCGTPYPADEEVQQMANALQTFQTMQASNVAAFAAAGSQRIDVWFHIIKSTSGLGAVTSTQITNQINVLNTAFVSTPFRFYLAGTDTTVNDAWFSSTTSSAAEKAMKSALRKGTCATLNVYTQNGGLNNVIGWGTFPTGCQWDTAYDGVVMLYATMPGGTSSANKGLNLVHEAGHWLGLYHPFQNGCTTTNDEVADTPAESAPNWDCATAYDSCPSLPGLDPIHNYMDYTRESCKNQFTQGQRDRMDVMAQTYRKFPSSTGTDCLVGAWSGWSSCSSASCGTQTRTRVIQTQPTAGGIPCPALTETQKCNTAGCTTGACSDQPAGWADSENYGCGIYSSNLWCTPTGEYGANWQAGWGSFADWANANGVAADQACCACGGGSTGGGAAPSATNCQVGAWTAWGTCSKTCGSGSRSRSRPVTVQPANGGTACPALSETQTCNTAACPGATNCQVGVWGAWGTCSKTCGGGVRARARTILAQPTNGGTACPATRETMACSTVACPCSNQPLNWVDRDSYSCSRYVYYKWCTATGGYGTGWNAAWGPFSYYAGTLGKAANQACCGCGGGSTGLGLNTNPGDDPFATGNWTAEQSPPPRSAPPLDTCDAVSAEYPDSTYARDSANCPMDKVLSILNAYGCSVVDDGCGVVKCEQPLSPEARDELQQC